MAKSTIDQRDLIPALFPSAGDFLFVTGLAGPAKNVCSHTCESDNVFALGGAMGAAACTALGMSIAAPEHQVVCVTGDGELIMGIGSLVTVSSAAPANLSIICIDNGRHGETGGQWGHTSRYTDLAKVAEGAGISNVLTISSETQYEIAKQFLNNGVGPRFLLAKVKDTQPAVVARNWNPIERRQIFQSGFRKNKILFANKID